MKTPETDALEFEVTDAEGCVIHVVSSCLSRKLERERDERSSKLDRILELATHDDTYWAIEEIGRICERTLTE